MHKWISTENGDQCFRCGMVLDYRDPDYEHEEEDAISDQWGEESRDLAFPLCGGPTLGRAHHYQYENAFGGPSLECAYGDSTVRPDTLPATVNLECIGA